MGVIFDHRDPGTPEDAWQAASPWAGCPALDLDVDLVVVLAAHPDDETLGAGGLLAEAAARGVAVSVIVVTDGDAAPPASPDLAGTRRRETLEAVGMLAPRAAVSFLGFRDGEVREQRAEIATAIERMLPRPAEGTRTLVAAPWIGDGHRDHRVLGEIALDLQRPDVRTVGYPVWLWHWGTPDAVDPQHWARLPLSTRVVGVKSQAIARHRSQLTANGDEAPIVHAGMRAHFERDVEVFVLPPAETAPSVDTAYFDGFFARHDDPWGFDSRWYERRKRALTVAALPRARYRAALELGCATGRLTALLAERCDALTAVDASAVALTRAAEHITAPHLRYVQARVPEQWPEGVFDLIVVSELLYYLDAADRAALGRRIASSLAPGGTLLACHWRHRIDDAPSDGDRVHRELGALGLTRAVAHVEDDFVLDVWVHDADESLARAEGLLP